MNLDGAVSAACRSFLFCSFKLFEQTTAYCGDDKSTNTDYRSTTDFKSFVLGQSQKFRDRLRELNEHLSSIAHSLADEDANDIDLVDRGYDLICGVEKSWYICEVFLLNPAKHLSLEMGKWLKESSYPYGSSELSIDFNHKCSMQQPELSKSLPGTDGATLGFWDSVFELLLQGNILFAIELLQKHSGIAYALLATDNQPQGYMSIRIDGEQCRLLCDTILSHPYAMMVNEGSASTDSEPDYTKEYHGWKQAVRRLRGEGQHSCATLIRSIPEIETVLGILTGDKTVIYSTVQNNMSILSTSSKALWMKLTLALILYAYPPLGKADLGKVVEEAVAAHNTRTSMNIEDEHSVRITRQVMRADIGPLLRQVYELQSISGSQPHGELQDMVSLACLASTAHLSLLLTYGAGVAVSSGLTQRLPDAPNEASFLEEVLIEVVQRLSQVDYFPLEMALGYASFCPTKGTDYVRCLLPRRVPRSDDDALEVAASLDHWGLAQEARLVLLSRAQWWLDRGTGATTDRSGSGDSGQSTARESAGSTDHHTRRPSTVPKAIYFLYMARDFCRISTLLDLALYRLMQAVVQSRTLFPGLSLHPLSAVESGAGVKAVSTEGGISRMDTEESPSQSLHIDKALLSAALLEAVDILSAVAYRGVDAADGTEDPVVVFVRKQIATMRIYVEAVRLRLELKPGGIAAFGCAACLLAGLLSGNRKLVQESGGLDVGSVGDRFWDCSSVCEPIVSVRYHLHILELIVWFCTGLASVESTNCPEADLILLNFHFDLAGASNGSLLDPLPPTEQTPLVRQAQHLPKTAAYALLQSFEDVLRSHAASRVVGGAVAVDNSDGPSSNSNGGRLDKRLVALRVNLLSVLTRGIVQENDICREEAAVWTKKDGDREREGEEERSRGAYPFSFPPPHSSSQQWIGTSQLGMKSAINAATAVVLNKDQIETYECLTAGAVSFF